VEHQGFTSGFTSGFAAQQRINRDPIDSPWLCPTQPLEIRFQEFDLTWINTRRTLLSVNSSPQAPPLFEPAPKESTMALPTRRDSRRE
jgi:hypothetical protein